MKIKTAVCMACYTCLFVVSLSSTASTELIKVDGLEKPEKTPEQTIANFSNFIDGVLTTHPSLISATSEIDATNFTLSGSQNPLYNPELVLEAENSDVASFQVGMVQTIDWQNKKAANIKQTTLAVKAAKMKYLATYEQIASEILFAMVNYLSSREVAILAKERVSLMRKFVDIANNRKSVGDINQVDNDVARLALAEAIMQLSESNTNIIDAEIALMSLTGIAIEKPIPFPTYLPKLSKTKQDINNLVKVHPDVVLAQMTIQMAKTRTQFIDTDRRANPTLSLSAGKNDADTLVGFSFSIPLMIRNNFSNEVSASRQFELQAEQSAQSVNRRVSANALLAQKRYKVMTNAWQIWIANGRPVLKSHQTNLEGLWRAGEIDVSQYLVQIKQSLDTQLRGSVLQGDVRMAWLNWLKATGQINMWLKKMKSGE